MRGLAWLAYLPSYVRLGVSFLDDQVSGIGVCPIFRLSLSSPYQAFMGVFRFNLTSGEGVTRIVWKMGGINPRNSNLKSNE